MSQCVKSLQQGSLAPGAGLTEGTQEQVTSHPLRLLPPSSPWHGLGSFEIALWPEPVCGAGELARREPVGRAVSSAQPPGPRAPSFPRPLL